MDHLTFTERWWKAIRPHSLGTALAPVLIGGGVAIRDGNFRAWAFLLAVLGVALLLIGVNLGNDYFDFRSGADPPIGVGGRPLQQGLLQPRTFLVGSIAAFVLAGAIGIFLALASPPSVLAIGLAGALLGFFYTAPPFRLGYRGLGEAVVFLCLGPGAAVGAYAVTSGQVTAQPVWAAIPIGFTVTALLHANNLRDLEDDSRTGKRTLAVRLGERGARAEYAVLIAGGMLATILLAAFLTPWAGLGLVAYPFSVPLVPRIRAKTIDGRALMRETASLNLRLATLLAVGFAISRFFTR
jgi:1,4-dihydroxy-2-naphthoate octaprenyltransferase